MSHFQTVQADAFSNYTASSASYSYAVNGSESEADRIADTTSKILAAKNGRNASAPKDAKKFLDWLNR
jgi:hypothetical protein